MMVSSRLVRLIEAFDEGSSGTATGAVSADREVPECADVTRAGRLDAMSCTAAQWARAGGVSAL